MEALKGPLTFFFPGDCYQEVVVNHNILNGEHSVFVFVIFSRSVDFLFVGQCLKLLNSRVLSLGIILGSVLGTYIPHTPYDLSVLMFRTHTH